MNQGITEQVGPSGKASGLYSESARFELDRHTNCSDWGFRLFNLVLPGECRIVK
jgi:hypothetical protein